MSSPDTLESFFIVFLAQVHVGQSSVVAPANMNSHPRCVSFELFAPDRKIGRWLRNFRQFRPKSVLNALRVPPRLKITPETRPISDAKESLVESGCRVVHNVSQGDWKPKPSGVSMCLVTERRFWRNHWSRFETDAARKTGEFETAVWI